MIFAWIAIVAAGLFAGAALYITLAEHPARMECGTVCAVTEFGPSYRRAAKMQASLAAIGLLAGVGAWLSLGHLALLIGAVVLGAVIPFTLLVIRPTNNRLLAPDLDAGSPAAAALLARWQRLHAVRTVLGLAAFGVFVWCVLATA